MDPVRFDGLTRVLSQVSGRRSVMALLAALPLGGVLTTLGQDEAAAERPNDRLQRRNRRRNQKQRNNKNHNQKNNKKNNGGGLGGSQCGATGSVCAQDSDCCTKNCFDFACAERVTTCGEGSTATRCLPPAKGCAGETCCNGSLACGDSCCQGAANQCNPQGACCAPNCAGRQCGDDGCGNGGTCGSCPTDQTCNTTTGICQGGSTCSAETCPNGCCDAAGQCQTGTSTQACGTGGVACAPCSGSTTTCLNGQCVMPDNTFTCKCNNLENEVYCSASPCNMDGIREVCQAICSRPGSGGWSNLGNTAHCALNTCVA